MGLLVLGDPFLDRPELFQPRRDLWVRDMTIGVCPRPELLSQGGFLP
jgi:hypothetical protein